jgi:excisionase family DNA binding protein
LAAPWKSTRFFPDDRGWHGSCFNCRGWKNRNNRDRERSQMFTCHKRSGSCVTMMMNRLKSEALLTAAEVSDHLRLPLSTVYHLAKSGKLQGFRVGRSWRFPAKELDRVSRHRGPQVLVVDDDADIRRFIEHSLSAGGCHVQEAAGVDAALQLTAIQTFDVLFIDLKMPGKSGTELIRLLDGRYSVGQIVLIPELSDLNDGAALSGIGGVTLLPKPLSDDGLRSCVERITGVTLATPRGGVHV